MPSPCVSLYLPLQYCIAYGTSRPHIWACKNQTFSCRQHHTCKTHRHQPIARMHQQPTCFSRLLQQLQQPCPPPSKHAHTHTHSTHLHINIIRHACTSLLLWWMTFGNSGSEHPPLGLISHCHKSIRERGMLDVFMSRHSFGATGLTSSH